MSRSKREPIYKDHHPKKKTNYHRTVRRVTNQKVRECELDPEKTELLPAPQEIIDDYDYQDWRIDLRNIPNNKKDSRK